MNRNGYFSRIVYINVSTRAQFQLCQLMDQCCFRSISNHNSVIYCLLNRSCPVICLCMMFCEYPIWPTSISVLIFRNSPLSWMDGNLLCSFRRSFFVSELFSGHHLKRTDAHMRFLASCPGLHLRIKAI